MKAFFNGDFVTKEKIFISPDDRGFLFADGLYEVIRSYGGRLFKIESHMDRLAYGAKEIRLRTDDFSYLIDVSNELVQQNNLIDGDALVYIQVTRGVAPRTHFFPSKETPLTVYASAKSFSPHTEEIEDGVNVIFVPDQRWERCDIKSVGLLINVMAQQQARDQHAAEAVFVRNGFITEGSHTNFFAVFDGEIITPPENNYILSGITRRAVLEICRHLSIPTKERQITESEIEHADELIIAGTTAEITPIVQINGVLFRSGKPGPITRRLQKAFRETTEFLSD